jgi:hypothetical protein
MTETDNEKPFLSSFAVNILISLGATVHIPIHPSKVVVQKLKMNGSRQKIIDRKAAHRQAARASKYAEGKFSEAAVSAMGTVD